LTLENLIGLVRERLGWMDEGFEVRFEGQQWSLDEDDVTGV
jgi:hypothetical protein